MNIDRIIKTLTCRNTGPLPRGELFIYQDFLDRFFQKHQGDYPAQIEAAAGSLGLSLVGIDLDTDHSQALLAEVAYMRLDRYFTVGCINGPVSRLIERYGFFDAMMSMKRTPTLFSCIVDALLADTERKARSAAANGLEAIAIADDIAGSKGLLFSPGYFCDTILPVYQKLAIIIKEHGLSPFFHSDGDVEAVIEPLIGAGYVCLHPVDPHGGLNIYEVNRRFNGRICFMGHIDILTGDEETIRGEVRHAEEVFKKGGLILGSACGISMATVSSRLRALYPSFSFS